MEYSQERAVECLKYFHGCFPLTQHGGTRERAARLHTALCDQRDDLLRVKATLPKDQPQMAALALQRINALLEMLHAALNRYGTPAA